MDALFAFLFEYFGHNRRYISGGFFLIPKVEHCDSSHTKAIPQPRPFSLGRTNSCLDQNGVRIFLQSNLYCIVMGMPSGTLFYKQRAQIRNKLCEIIISWKKIKCNFRKVQSPLSPITEAARCEVVLLSSQNSMTKHC